MANNHVRLLELVLEEVNLLKEIPVSPERLCAQSYLRSLSLINLTGEREIGLTSSSVEELRREILWNLSVMGSESIFNSRTKEVQKNVQNK